MFFGADEVQVVEHLRRLLMPDRAGRRLRGARARAAAAASPAWLRSGWHRIADLRKPVVQVDVLGAGGCFCSGTMCSCRIRCRSGSWRCCEHRNCNQCCTPRNSRCPDLHRYLAMGLGFPQEINTSRLIMVTVNALRSHHATGLPFTRHRFSTILRDSPHILERRR